MGRRPRDRAPAYGSAMVGAFGWKALRSGSETYGSAVNAKVGESGPEPQKSLDECSRNNSGGQPSQPLRVARDCISGTESAPN